MWEDTITMSESKSDDQETISEMEISVFSVDDHPLLHEGLAAVIRHQSDMRMVAEAVNGREAIQRFREHMPDVTLMDLRLPDMSGIDAMLAIRAEFPQARIIMLTTFANDTEIQRAFEAGARAYLLKNMPAKELVETIRQVYAGQKRIPPELAAPPVNRNSDTKRETKNDLHPDEVAKVADNRDVRSSQETLQRWTSQLFRRR